ncbi:pilus assembly protein CpaE [[Bacillus] enclensis]|uniref:Pilus assembly protein CpaE n=1 Tax=[Bacillus] enclensis TaxID=1402860 RepID=A0A0V8H551_9BACI|nr:AAA family ATPase [[Bacillus] enclensis]KSU57607.1 pilus assembly protein CpaE [[Bacillus] enclensis]SCC36961.1 pilus assembly protein CpaE [[Bacillus] enclensis]
MNKNKYLIISNNQSVTDQFKSLLAGINGVEAIKYADVKSDFDRLAPDVVFLVQSEEDSGIDLIQYMQSINTDHLLIYIAINTEFETLRAATRAGVADFFVIPDELNSLASKLDKIDHLATEKKSSTDEAAATNTKSFKKGRGMIYSFYSGKGGSGRTLVSSTFAQTLKLESTAQVIFIDLNLQFGGSETFLSIESNRSLADLSPVINELNENHIRNVSEKEKHSKLEVLLSPRDAEVGESVTEEFIATLLRTCRRNYDFVVVDLPVQINEQTYRALEESDRIYYVLNLDTPSLQVLRQVELLFSRLGIDAKERMTLIVNKVSKENEIQPGDVKNLTDYPIEVKIKNDSRALQSYVNKGEIVRKEANEKKLPPFAKDIHKWVISKLG